MIQRILLILCLLIPAFTMAETKPYPEKWEDEESQTKYQTLDDLQNTYWKIYTDTNNESELEILERMKWHENEFTENELNQYRSLSIPQVSFEKDFRISDQVRSSSVLERVYQYEKELLRLENDMDLRSWTENVFVNDSIADSPFDLIEDMHAIETTLFGKKFEEQKFDPPKFLVYDEDQRDPIPDLEDWQDGREKTLQGQLQSRDYQGRDHSITGALAGLKKYSKELLSRPLISGKSTHNYMESTNHSETAKDTYGADVVGYGPPSPDDKFDPEVETVLLEAPWDQQEGIIKSELTDEADLRLYSNINMGKLISQVTQKSSTQTMQEEVKFQEQLEDWRNRMEYLDQEHYQQIVYPRFQRWNQDIETLLEGFIKVRKIWEQFLEEKDSR